MDGPVANMSLTNLRTGDALEAQLQPEELEAAIAVGYNELAILGYSHKPLQFMQTENLEIPVELRFYRLWKSFDLKRATRFLMALAHPMRSDSVEGGGTPDVLLVWPNFLSVRCRVREVRLKATRFERTGEPIFAVFRLKLHRVSDTRILSEDIGLTGLEVAS